jgi:hypothetical protein
MLRGAVLIGGAGAIATFLRKRSGGDAGPQPQSFSDASRPTGEEQRPTPPTPVRPATATGEGTGAVTATQSESLNTPEAQTDAVKPDKSEGDPLVEEQVAKAQAEAGAVGGNVQEMAESEPGFPSDPEMRPVIEGSGDDAEAAEQTDAELGGNRERRP